MSSCRWKKYLDTFSHIGAENTCFKNSTGSYAPCRTLFAGFFTLWPIIGDFYIPLEVLHRAAPANDRKRPQTAARSIEGFSKRPISGFEIGFML
jgi:hypothetical protein